jgi:hypothetical protein
MNMQRYWLKLKRNIRKKVLSFLQIQQHEDLSNFLDNPDIQIARRAVSNALFGFDRNKENPTRRIEIAYNNAQRDGCTLSGWELRLVLYHEAAIVSGLYKRFNA